MRRSIWDCPWFIIPVQLFFIAGLAINLVVPHGEEILYLNAWRYEPYNTLFRLATVLGELPLFFLIGIPLLFWSYRYALLIALTGVLTSPIAYITKDQIAKDRPITWFRERGQDTQVVVVPDVFVNSGRTSFPSGHTMAAFGLYSSIAVIAAGRHPRLGLLFALLAILTALSRIFLVQHFLADVLGGAFFGLVVAELARRLVNTAYFRRLRFLDRGLLPVKTP
jgi:membrane-associated phospholipid phosphatase